MNFKPILILAASLFCLGLASPWEDLVDERTRSPGRVCLEGQSCGRGSASQLEQPVQQVASGPRDGAAVYKAGCAVCHDAGVGGAHVLGKRAVWKTLQAKGQDQLIANAINGVGAMPARGVCINCSDKEIANAVSYMLDAAGL